MPKLKHTIQHTLPIGDAKARLQASLVESLTRQSGQDFLLCDESWQADIGHYAFMVGSYSISMQIRVRVGQLEINGKIPLAALPFRRQIKKDFSAIANQILSG